MSGKHAKSVFYQSMYIINVFHVILYIKIYFAQTRLCIVIVVNRRCDVSNAISSEISMDRKLAWLEKCTCNYMSKVGQIIKKLFSPCSLLAPVPDMVGSAHAKTLHDLPAAKTVVSGLRRFRHGLWAETSHTYLRPVRPRTRAGYSDSSDVISLNPLICRTSR